MKKELVACRSEFVSIASWRRHSCLRRRDSDLLMPTNSVEPNGEDLKKLTNKLKHVPHRVEHALACSSRFFILPQLGSLSFHIDSEIPSDLRRSESRRGSLKAAPPFDLLESL